MSVDQLQFDPQNPRLPHSIVDSDDESEVINWMLSDASIIELMGSIGEKGFFPGEPLLVVKNKKKQNKYIVVEGNRRLTASKLLLHPNLAKKKAIAIGQISTEAREKPDELPVLVFPDRKDILDYLGFKHITGVKSWGALAKAKYLRQLQEEYKGLSKPEQYRKLAKAIGSRADYVKELLIGLDVYDRIHNKDYFGINGLNEDTIDFGVYYNALRYPNIAEYIGINKTSDNPTKELKIEKLKELSKWISEKDGIQNKTKLGESRNLSKLNAIVEKPKALSLFQSGRSIDEALIYTEEPYELFRLAIINSLASIKEAHNTFPIVAEPSKSDLDNLNELSKTVVALEDLVELRLSKLKKIKK